MEPYYQDNHVTIYHADCREILPELEPVDLVLTDPPYGISYCSSHNHNTAGKWAIWRRDSNFEPIHGDDKPFDPTFILDLEVPLIIWGANHFAQLLPPSKAWLVWDKLEGATPVKCQSDCEMAWTNLNNPVRLFSWKWRGIIRRGDENVSRQHKCHPNQKPIALMKWCLGLLGDGKVLDPFMGSGTTLRAAKDLGRKAIGIEIEEKYCEIAAKRMAQEVLF